MIKGARVRMTDKFKESLAKGNGKQHLKEFGKCIGVVTGYTDYISFGQKLTKAKIGPEVDVYWQPSNLRFAYHPDDLEVISTNDILQAYKDVYLNKREDPTT